MSEEENSALHHLETNTLGSGNFIPEIYCISIFIVIISIIIIIRTSIHDIDILGLAEIHILADMHMVGIFPGGLLAFFSHFTFSLQVCGYLQCSTYSKGWVVRLLVWHQHFKTGFFFPTHIKELAEIALYIHQEWN